MLIRFVDGRPVSLLTNQFLGWLAARLANEGKQALLVVWDNASWHVRRGMRTWMKTPNQRLKHAWGCRMGMCRFPSKSLWLNRIEPNWVHGKRAIAESTRKPTGAERRQWICTYYHCELLDPIAQAVA
jgi:hypothetical protein